MSVQFDVVAFGPHPDDVEFVMAGTMIKFARAGYKVIHIALTDSAMSTHGDIETRRKEFEKAAKLIGCECRMLDFIDTGIENDRESRVKIATILRELKPKVVFAPYHTNPLGEPRGLAHVDHYTSGQLIRDSVKFARLQRIIPDLPAHAISKLYFYMVPRDVWANFVVDVSDVIEETKAVIRAYASQVTPIIEGMSTTDVLIKRRAYAGISIGSAYAETFVCDTPSRMRPEDFFRL